MPVWPSCFCSIWPMPAPAPMRSPAAEMPMSFMVTPASASAPERGLGRKVHNVLVGVLAELRHVDARGSRVFSDADAIVLDLTSRFEAEANCLGAFLVRTDQYVASLTFMPVLHVFGVGGQLITFPRTLVPSQSMTAGHEGHRNAGRGEGHDGERRSSPSVGDVCRRELRASARGAGVAAVEEPGAAGGAFVGHQVRAHRPAPGSRPAGSASPSCPQVSGRKECSQTTAGPEHRRIGWCGWCGECG